MLKSAPVLIATLLLSCLANAQDVSSHYDQPTQPSIVPMPAEGPVAKASTPTPETLEPIGFVPLPVYATLPNEGATYGFMPVFLGNNAKGQVETINAPSVTWNGVSHVTFTGRYYQFPNNFEERIFQATYATRLFREAIADWNVMPIEKGDRTHNLSFQYRSDPYRRFYGLGMHTGPSDESSYTLRSTKVLARVGYNVEKGMNVNGTVGFNHFDALRDGVLGIKSTFDTAPTAPGLGGANTVYALAGLRFDTRPQREYSLKGILLDVKGGFAYSSVARTSNYGINLIDLRGHVPQTDWANGVARLYAARVYGARVPFYERPSLGGSFLMRGFILDRYIDNGAWTAEFEERFTVWVLRVQGSEVHLQVDPFVSVGQVYHRFPEAFKRVQFTQGVGLRAYTPPNVVGRIDIANDDQQLAVYVELGYPF